MNVAAVRDDLARTGVLFTQNEEDVGHISDFWRGKIKALCDYTESLPINAAELLAAEKHIHAEARNALAFVEKKLRAANERIQALEAEVARVEADNAPLRQLVDEAVPRMQTLNNAMSPGWLARAAALLEG